MRKQFVVVRKDLYDKDEVLVFMNTLSEHTSHGFSIESCGISGDTARIGWAILSRVSEVKSEKEFDMLDAARRIAKACRDRTDGCDGCPLNKGTLCLAGLKGKAIPASWPVLREV